MNSDTPFLSRDIEPEAQSFVIKLWLEAQEDRHHKRSWRGYISHVPSNKRHYVKRLDEISDFVAEHLIKEGVDLGWWWKLRHSLPLSLRG